jgi:predicted ArsR family transcriptional regulator
VTEGPASEPAAAPRLAILKALGDNTRYAIYLELARSPIPLSTADIAESLDLHPNTVRPHLERMREVGLLLVESDAKGGVGRPQHLYSIAADAPSLGFEPPAFPTLARLLLRVAAASGAAADDAADAGRDEGRHRAGSRRGETAAACVAALDEELARLGFDPAVAADEDGATIAFTHCPFRELAETNPDIVCNLHRGLVEGFVERVGGAEVVAFHTLVDRVPCQVSVAGG